MYRIKNKLLALALAVLMFGSVTGAAFLLNGSGSKGAASADNDGITLTEEDELKYADTSSVFDSSVVNIQPSVTGKQWLLVSLDGKPLAERRGDTDLTEYINSEDGINADEDIRDQQKSFLSKLSKAGIPYDYKYGYTALTNTVAVCVDVKYADDIAEIKGVTSVNISEKYYAPQDEEVTNNANVHSTGIYQVDDSLGLDGEGMVAAVLDTGLDASHPAFTVEPENPKFSKEDVQQKIFESSLGGGFIGTLGQEATVDDVYYSSKVPFAYDYADKDTDVYPSYSHHGTHVAGIIAGADLQGQYLPGFTDEDGNLVDLDGNLMENANGAHMQFTGVAPNAQLAICKVFSDNEVNGVVGLSEEMDILAALEDCVKLGVDVINMSLGSSAGFSTGDNEMMTEVYDSVREAGIMLVVAASNDYSSSYGSVYGTNFTSNPDSATVGSPSTLTGALSVASINGQESKYIRAGQGTDAKFLYFSEASDGNNNEKDFVAELIAALRASGVVPTQEDGVDVYAVPFQAVPGYGTSINYSGNVNVSGKVALIRRGGNVSFEDKVRIAMQNGAIACVIYNNVSGTIRMSLGNLSNPVPTCSVTMDAAAPVVAQGSGTMYISNGYTAGPFMSDFSSWGPTPDLKLKPEISAHGGEIISSVPNGWAEYSGTSMASPNMAGAMSLILSYVNNEANAISADIKPGDITHDDVALANFLVMSTATIAKDEFNNPYSPRKQGAGLADITKSVNTQAYLYSEGIDKAKIEIGDDKERSGVYNLTFRLRNISDAPRTYKLGVQTMTETVASDGLTVAERAYMLDDCVITYSVDGEAITGGSVTVPGKADVQITAKVQLSDKAKEYLNESFKNGMYVEGYVTLTDMTEGEKVDLNIPWLGFYGDWYDAPMFDISEYELEAALADASIPEDEKPEAVIYPTVPVGSYYNEAYVIPLGTYLYSQDNYTRKIYSDTDKASVSIYDDETKRTVSQLNGIYAGLLRGASEMTVTITDAATGEIVETYNKTNIRKSFTAGSSSAHASLVELDFSALERGLENNRKYLVHMEGVLDNIDDETNVYDPDKYDYGKSFDFTFYVDTEAPEIVDYRVRYVEHTDENDRVTYSVYLDVDVYDNHYSQAIALCFADYSTMSLELLDNDMTPIYSSRNSTTTVTLDITDYYDQDIELYIQVDDYALNARAYRVNGMKSFEDAVDYPEQIDIVSGDDVAEPNADYDKQIAINVNQALTLETLATPADANTVNLFWHSFNEDVVRVQNGTIFGVSPGTALVKVYSGKDEYSADSAGILVTVTDTVDPAPKPQSIEFGLISDGDNRLVNPTNATVSVNQNEVIDLHVNVKPWYYDANPVVKWASSRPQVASVDPVTGKVTTLSEGTAIITATLIINGETSLYTASTTLSVGPEFVVSNGTLMEYHGKGGDVTIPANLNVYYIYEEAFMDNDNITSLEITAPCSEIQTMAFANMKKLERVILPDSMEYIHAYAFYGCPNLKYIDIHGGATTFGNYCFMECTSLEEIRGIKLLNGLKGEDVEILDLEAGKDYEFVSPNLTSVGLQAFFGCTSLEELDLTMMRYAGFAAFGNCTSLKKVKLSRYTDISDNMFIACEQLTTLEYIDVTEENIGDIIHTDAEAPFYGCNISEIIFSSDGAGGAAASAYVLSAAGKSGRLSAPGVSVFATDDLIQRDEEGNLIAIYGDAARTRLLFVAQNVTSFEVPATVTEIAANAFAGNDGLKEVTFQEGCNLVSIGNYAFSATGLTSIAIPATVTSIGTGAFSWCEQLASADLSQYQGSIIPAEAFYYSPIASVKWGPNVTSIGRLAFSHTAITSLDLSQTKVNSLADSAFEGCPYLTDVKLGAIEYMGDRVFASDGNGVLASVKFEENSTALGTNTFFAQTRLASVELPVSLAELDELGEGVFYGCMSLEEVPFTSLTKIGANAFTGCIALTGIDLDSVTVIGTQAFYGCRLLGNVEFPALTEVGSEAFYGCSALTSLDAAQLKSVGDSAFEYSGIASVNVPALETVGKYAFAFSGITGGEEGKFILPAGLKSVGDGAFAGLTAIKAFEIDTSNEYFITENGILYENVGNGLQLSAFPAGFDGDVSVKEGTVRIGASAFERASGVTSVWLPYELKSIGDRAFFDCGAKKYEFDCLTAPTLEAAYLTADDFEEDDPMYAILDRDGNIGSEKYYSNFKDYLALKIYNGQYGIDGIDDFGLTLICHENATGFTDNRLYTLYFSTITLDEVIPDDNTRAANASIAALPEVSAVQGLTSADTETWAEFKALAKTARDNFNKVSASQLAHGFVPDSDKLYAVEAAMRAKAPEFGETVTMQRLSVTTMPDKMTYTRGEVFNSTGMQLTLYWSDGSREIITSGYEVVDGDRPLSLTDSQIRITYNGLSTQLNLTVVRPPVKAGGLAIRNYPSNSVALPGDPYTGAGLELGVTFEDGITETFYNGFTVTAAPLQEGDNLITVTYEGQIITYTVVLQDDMLYHPGTLPGTDNESGDNGGGLGTGAIVGICVGCVAVVAAAAVVTVVMLRRRNNK